MDEEQFILRLTPKLAQRMRVLLGKTGTVPSSSLSASPTGAPDEVRNDAPPLPLPPKFEIQFLSERHAAVTVDGEAYPATLMDLPCIVESHKSPDKSLLFKSCDIHQVLVVREHSEPAPEDFQLQNGLTMASKGARERFRVPDPPFTHDQVSSVEVKIKYVTDHRVAFVQKPAETPTPAPVSAAKPSRPTPDPQKGSAAIASTAGTGAPAAASKKRKTELTPAAPVPPKPPKPPVPSGAGVPSRVPATPAEPAAPAASTGTETSAVSPPAGSSANAGAEQVAIVAPEAEPEAEEVIDEETFDFADMLGASLANPEAKKDGAEDARKERREKSGQEAPQFPSGPSLMPVDAGVQGTAVQAVSGTVAPSFPSTVAKSQSLSESERRKLRVEIEDLEKKVAAHKAQIARMTNPIIKKNLEKKTQELQAQIDTKKRMLG